MLSGKTHQSNGHFLKVLPSYIQILRVNWLLVVCSCDCSLPIQAGFFESLKNSLLSSWRSGLRLSLLQIQMWVGSGKKNCFYLNWRHVVGNLITVRVEVFYALISGHSRRRGVNFPMCSIMQVLLPRSWLTWLIYYIIYNVYKRFWVGSLNYAI